MKQFVNTAHASGTYTAGGTSIPAEAFSQPVTVAGGIPCVCRKVEIPDLACVCSADVCKTAIRSFAVCGHTVLRAGYQLRIRYRDTCGAERSISAQGDVLFFDMDPDTQVRFLNPPQIVSGCCGAEVCFRVLLEEPPAVPVPCPGSGGPVIF